MVVLGQSGTEIRAILEPPSVKLESLACLMMSNPPTKFHSCRLIRSGCSYSFGGLVRQCLNRVKQTLNIGLHWEPSRASPLLLHIPCKFPPAHSQCYCCSDVMVWV